VRDTRRDAAGLLSLFQTPRAFYTLAEARRVAGVSPARLTRAIAEGEVEPVLDGDSVVLEWADVVALALTRWPPRQLARILRDAGCGDALPPLNRFHTIAVELPVYQLRLLHYLAEQRSPRDGPPLTVSDVLEYELCALASEEDLPAMDRMIPGFAAAAHDALLHERPQAAQGCVFCGADGCAAHGICAACRTRHVPVGGWVGEAMHPCGEGTNPASAPDPTRETTRRRRRRHG
jgi:hypothetical protein